MNGVIGRVDVSSYVAAIYEQAGYELAAEYGVLVIDFERKSPAEDAGVQGATKALRYGWNTIPGGGDIIIAVDGYTTETLADLLIYLETNTAIGDTIELTVMRDDREVTIPVVVGERPADSCRSSRQALLQYCSGPRCMWGCAEECVARTPAT